MKIKLKDNVVHSGGHGAGQHHKKGSVADLPDDVAKSLVTRDLAVEVKEKPDKPDKADDGEKDPTRKELFETYKNASKEDLLKVKDAAEKALADNPDYGPAKTALSVVTELLKKKQYRLQIQLGP